MIKSLFLLLATVLLFAFLSCLGNENSAEKDYGNILFEVAVEHYDRADAPYCLDFNVSTENGTPLQSVTVMGKYGPFSLYKVSSVFWNANICRVSDGYENTSDLPRPDISEAYGFHLHYDDGSKRIDSAHVTGVVDYFTSIHSNDSYIKSDFGVSAISGASPSILWFHPEDASQNPMPNLSGFKVQFLQDDSIVVIDTAFSPNGPFMFDYALPENGALILDTGKTCETRVWSFDNLNTLKHNVSVSSAVLIVETH